MDDKTIEDTDGVSHLISIKWDAKRDGWHVFIDNDPARFAHASKVGFPTARNILNAAT